MKDRTIDQLYPKLIRSVLENGVSVASPRGMKVKELYNVGFSIKNAQKGIIVNPNRAVNLAYAAIEMLGNFQDGAYNVDPFTWYCKPMKNYLNPETGLWDGSYATRLTMYKQMEKMYNILNLDPDSRRAVIQIYNPAHDFHDYESRDICCTLSLIFRLREGKLNLTCTMRSNDVLLGVPYDLTQFTFLQSVLACWLGVEVGEYYHFTANLHAYERDWKKLENIARGKWLQDPHNWNTMDKWDIPDINETFVQIRRFFNMEKYFRENYKREKIDIVLILDNFKITSQFLRNIFLQVIVPYVLKKS